MTTSINKRKEEFEKLKKDAKILAEHLLDEEKPIKVHLMDIDQAIYSDKKIEAEVMVCAKDEVYHVPKVFTAECKNDKCKVSEGCLYYYQKQTIHILSNAKELIDFTQLPDYRINGVLRSLVHCESGKRSYIQTEVIEKISIQDFLVIPKVTTIQTIKEEDNELVVDELGREYKDKQVFATKPLPKSNEYFKVTGWVKANPKNQVATIIINDLVPLSDDFQEFAITKEIAESFEVFKVEDGSNIDLKISEILSDLTNNVTNIYGGHPQKVLLGILLTYHSVIGFKFDKETLKRGWVEMVIIGDTGMGKTQMFERIQKHIRLGAFITGTAAYRTGVVYSFQQFGRTWYLIWGIYVLCDGKLLFIDEGQCIKEEEWNKLSSGRSDGKITATGIKSGEHSTRTRLIISCNPKDNLPLDESMCGVALLKGIFRAADIRRIDLPAFMGWDPYSSKFIDVPSEERAHSEHKITSDVLHNSVCWAWTRTVKNIKFEPEAVTCVYAVAKELRKKYERATDIPIVTSDARHKTARLVVSLACLLHSTDDSHEDVIVKKEHVEYIRDYLMYMFDHEHCSLNIYAALRKEVTALSEEEYRNVLVAFTESDESIGEGGFSGSYAIPEEIKTVCLEFANNEMVERSHLADILDLTADNVSKKLKLFKELQLIKGKSGKKGYKVTSKFKKVLRNMLNEGLLDK